MEERDIFLDACEIEDPDARNAFLDKACGAGTSLRHRLQVLIGLHQTAADFLDTPAIDQVIPPRATPTEILEPLSTVRNSATTDDPQALLATQGTGPTKEISLHFLQASNKPDSLGRMGDYEIQEVVGRGAFGIVLKAFDEVLRRVVAIKVMSPDLAATLEARQRFLREARASAAVRHENVVQIHAVGEQPVPYLVMEYIPGRTVQQQVDEGGPYDVTDVVRLGQQIALGLAAAHATGLIHRDIKPSNILIEIGTGRVKISDFGLARAADDASVSQSGYIAGTPMYMSPEQVLGEPLDVRTDLFSLGGVLYFLASGQTPFQASTTLAILRRVAEQSPRPLREINPNVPNWLCRIVAKLQAKRPIDQFGSAEEVSNLLGQCLLDLQSGRVPKTLEDFSGRSRSRRAGRAFAAAIVLLAVVAAFAFRGSLKRDRDPANSHVVVPIGLEPIVTETPIDLGPRITSRDFDDGLETDVSFDATKNLVVFKGEESSRNIWISFRDVERSNATIETRLRILNPHHSGFVKFVFKQYPHTEAFAIISSSPEGNRIWINDAINPGWEKNGVVVTQLGASEWFDLRFSVSPERYSVAVDGNVVLEVPREDGRPGYIAIGESRWQVEMKDLHVTLHDDLPASTRPDGQNR